MLFLSQKMDDDLTYEEGGVDAGASKTIPMQCSALRKNGYVLLKGQPCKIMEMSTSKTGKHGHAKVHLVGLHVFTNKKYEDICPSTHNMEVPVIKRNDYQLVDISSDKFLTTMDDAGSQREDIKLCEGELGTTIETKFEEGADMMVTVMTAMGEEQVVGYKNITK